MINWNDVLHYAAIYWPYAVGAIVLLILCSPKLTLKIIARIIRDSRPRSEWESWLNPADL